MNKKEEIKDFISKKLFRFEKEAENNEINAELAKLRRGVGKKPGEMPEIYGVILQDMPEDFWSDNGYVTKEEWSCYITLTLYALHQQGNNIKLHNMHTDNNVSIGMALNYYVKMLGDSNARERMQKKLQILVTSKDIKELSYHMRSIIELLKGMGISINYKKLALDIYEFQFSDTKERVCLRWGQDFYRKNIEEN